MLTNSQVTSVSKIHILLGKKINVFLRHRFSENDVEGRAFNFYFLTI